VAYAGYWQERARYQEQVRTYWRYRVNRSIGTSGLAAAEAADLRLEAERTRFRVSTWGRPWTWLLVSNVANTELKDVAS